MISDYNKYDDIIGFPVPSQDHVEVGESKAAVISIASRCLPPCLYVVLLEIVDTRDARDSYPNDEIKERR
jgi:hypothetical protein